VERQSEKSPGGALRAGALALLIVGFLALVTLGASGAHGTGHARLAERQVPNTLQDSWVTLLTIAYVVVIVAVIVTVVVLALGVPAALALDRFEFKAKGVVQSFFLSPQWDRRGGVAVPKPAGLSPKSVRNIHGLLHRALNDAVAWGYLFANPAHHAVLPRRTVSNASGAQASWTVEELGLWLKLALKDRYSGLWVLAATTGMRRSELAGVQRELLDLDAEWLIVADTRVVVDGRVEDSDGKTAAGRRTLSLDSFTVKHLREYVALIESERQVVGDSYPDHGYLAARPDGVRLHPDTLTRRFNRIVDRAGVPRIRLHDVRHTYATLAMDAGVDPKMLSDRMGHANTAITLQIYTHRSTGKDRDLARSVSEVIENALGLIASE